MNATDLKLYLVTHRYDDNEATFLAKIAAACENGVTMVQLREKMLSTRAYFELAQRVKLITDRYQIPLIIDDRVDICLAVDAAGVHIGDDELPVAMTRQLIGPDKVLGVSTKTVQTAVAAIAAGADYLGVGAIFPTQTKANAAVTPIATLKAITVQVAVPVVAIGGVKEANLATFKDTGIAGVAIVSEIMQAPDIAHKVQALRTKLKVVLPNDR
ncbi:thiamine phosphate synthase [Lacticaseibacillus paracasei]|jgi:thiamine-phosphate pyrophosphorylase|uniref:Thiamine-phosphate synthase n=1 Tax=Lacticaseibacillus paracasei subsp. paracasei Lpp41 TaxID=1256208 RepID=A0A829H744_LACPA|nr:thiamine phosphate synthase [Lacticaseibacillus paracasei]EKQ24143.1 thiamin-phosphate pyrophosphorylase [Lacticaseibacillus casei UW4]EPC72051.1 thiamine-phosphate pyrophosphorylase [Lacticaseibacillus paracasei subsp. paracasei Lpp41]ATH00269.1 thiamine-phosphate diphosphorylase [Lacticaseibacillus paracasei]MBU6045586.1 thiamine phosphate synthase [Lacticaseibacillus paracasei]MBU6048253.1 thiamine phosphate synthase [Lacticaseibacillus paracasei]